MDSADGVSLAALAVLFLAAYAWPILHRTLSHSLRQLCTVVVHVSWAMFAVDYVGRFGLAEMKRTFVWRNLLDLASIALPVVRPLRLLRLVARAQEYLRERATGSASNMPKINQSTLEGLLVPALSLEAQALTAASTKGRVVH